MTPSSPNDKIPEHAYLDKPILYINHVPQSLPEADLMRCFAECLKARPVLHRNFGEAADTLSGHIEFERVYNAEKAYAVVQDIHLQQCNYKISLQLTADKTEKQDPKPTARPRLIKQLPVKVTPGIIFDRFRVFGPIYRIALQTDLGYSHTIAVVDYYQEEHAMAAQSALHCADFDGHTIAVQVYETAKGPIKGLKRSSWAEAPAFVPRHSSASNLPGANASIWSSSSSSPPRRFSSGSLNFTDAMMQYGMPAPVSMAPVVDPTNLFVKNLDPCITSQDLFAAFKAFGKIISARVMRDEQSGLSKEFGFVSFARAEDAALAQQNMNNQRLVGQNGVSPAVTVRFHEPKKQRISYGGTKRPYGLPREREGSFDAAANMAEDIQRRLSGIPSPPTSPLLSPSSPMSPENTLSSAVLQEGPVPSANPAATRSELSEKDRFLLVIKPFSKSQREAEQLVDLLMSLSKKDRAMCLFNPETLAMKVQDAKTVLSAVESPTYPAHTAYPTPDPTPMTRAQSKFDSNETIWTLPALAALPATEIIRICSSENPPVIAAAASASVVTETDAFVDSLEDKKEHEQKQKIGEKLFKIIKSFGFKSSPKLTIYLLDHEDLRSLAHLMNEQPEILKEKINLIHDQII